MLWLNLLRSMQYCFDGWRLLAFSGVSHATHIAGTASKRTNRGFCGETLAPLLLPIACPGFQLLRSAWAIRARSEPVSSLAPRAPGPRRSDSKVELN